MSDNYALHFEGHLSILNKIQWFQRLAIGFAAAAFEHGRQCLHADSKIAIQPLLIASITPTSLQ